MPLHLRHPAVHEQLDVVRVAGVVRGQEHGRLGDLVRVPDPAGTAVAMPALNSFAFPAEPEMAPIAGLSIGPGLTAFTRILRAFRSVVQSPESFT